MVNVLFVCIGNSCRSQMAEGFARKYGSDVLASWSAGLAPALIVQPMTIAVMRQKNIDIREQFPKSVHELQLNAFNVVFNLSGLSLPAGVDAEVRVWDVVDPINQPEEVYIRVRDQIEGLVMQYILELRRNGRRDKAPLPRQPVNTTPLPGSIHAADKDVSDKSGDLNVAPPTGQRFGFGRVRRSRD